MHFVTAKAVPKENKASRKGPIGNHHVIDIIAYALLNQYNSRPWNKVIGTAKRLLA